MDNPNFDFEFYSEVEDLDENVRGDTLRQLENLAAGQDDMIGAAVKLEKYAIGEKAFQFLASVEAFTRPEYIRAAEKADEPEVALRNALKAIERQVRENRDKRGKTWQQP